MLRSSIDPFTVPGTLDSLDAIADYVEAAAAKAGLDRKATYRLRMAVDEIVTNIVTHGYGESGLEGNVSLWVDTTETALTISIEDTAVPYDPLEKEMPTDLDEPLEKREMGGLGVYLAMQNVDQFLYEFVEGRNRNILVVNRPTVCAEPCVTC